MAAEQLIAPCKGDHPSCTYVNSIEGRDGAKPLPETIEALKDVCQNIITSSGKSFTVDECPWAEVISAISIRRTTQRGEL